MKDRKQEVMEVVTDLFSRKPDWMDFYRGVMGLDGVIRTAYPTSEEYAKFEESEEYAQIEKMLVDLRDQGAQAQSEDTQRVLTVRMPQYIHDAIKEEARERAMSINRLCLAKLMQKLLSAEETPRRSPTEKLVAAGENNRVG